MFIDPSVDLGQVGVYAIVNLCDGYGTAYVGSTCASFRQRLSQHKGDLGRNEHGNRHLQGAWNKYGAGAFCFHIVEVSEDGDLDRVVGREQFWLDRFRGSGRVYNFGKIAKNPMLGRRPSDETRQKMREAASRRPPPSKEANRKRSEALRGRPRPEEVKRKIGRAHRGKKLSLEHRRKLSEAHKWQTLSPLGRRRASEANARPYPAFINRNTGEIIPAGHNLEALCKKIGLCRSGMGAVKNGLRKSHKGWVLVEGDHAQA